MDHLGQSFGGFCALNFCHCAGRAQAALFTGGLPPISGHADRVYEPTMIAYSSEMSAAWLGILKTGRRTPSQTIFVTTTSRCRAVPD